MNKRSKQVVVILLALLVFALSACSSKIEEDIPYVEYDKSGEDNIVFEVEHTIDDERGENNAVPVVESAVGGDENRKEEDKNRTGLTEDDVMNLLKKDMIDTYLYEIALLETDEFHTYALVVKKGSTEEITPNTISFNKSNNGILLIAVDNETRMLNYLFEGTKNDYLKQTCLLRVNEEVYFLLIRKMNYNEWERFTLDTFVLDDSKMRQVYREVEGDNLYDYWFSHKAEFCADGTIEISKRIASFDSYKKYIHNFCAHAVNDELTFAMDTSWEEEYKEGLYEFISKQTWKDISQISLDNWAEVDILLKIKQCKLLNEKIDITLSECAVLVKEDMGRFCLFIVKGKNDFHQVGLQNLILLLYDREKSDFITERVYMGDFSDAYLFEANNEVYIAYYTETMYTGIPTTSGGVLMLQEDKFVKIWPSADDGISAFAGKVAELTEDGRYIFSTLEWNINESGMIINFDLVPSETVSVFDIIKLE